MQCAPVEHLLLVLRSFQTFSSELLLPTLTNFPVAMLVNNVVWRSKFLLTNNPTAKTNQCSLNVWPDMPHFLKKFCLLLRPTTGSFSHFWPYPPFPSTQTCNNASPHCWTTDAKSLQISTSQSSPSQNMLASKFCIRGLNCHQSPRWYCVSLHWWCCKRFECFHLCDLWRDNINTQNLQPKFSHVSIKKTNQKSCSPHGFVTQSSFEHFMSSCFSFPTKK